MCGFVGFSSFKNELSNSRPIIEKMNSSLIQRGPDEFGYYINKNVALGHRRLIVVDPEGGKQPMIEKFSYGDYVICYNGQIYNTKELREILEENGFHFNSHSDTEVLLKSYIHFGNDIVNHLNGIFAFAIWNEHKKELFLARDHFGVKPLFYTIQNDTLIFSSEIKGIFEYPGIKKVLDSQGICELFGIGPAHTGGTTVFKNIYELKPAHFAVFNSSGFHIKRYWKLVSKEHHDNLAQTSSKLKFLLNDAITRQLVSDVPLCTFLSGGLDSSIITKFASDYCQKEGLPPLDTYSIDYVDNDKNFVKSDFQPNSDNYYIELMSKNLHTNHHNIVIDTPELASYLEDAMIARDTPGMADIDSSLLLFCKNVKKERTVSLTGECADEIFGGYPWFYREELINIEGFPWMRDFDKRMELFNDDIQALNIKNYVLDKYHQTLNEIDYHDYNFKDTNKRKMIYLNMEWFMQTLLTRSDSQTMHSSIELRVPFANKDIVSYLYNVPWEYMYHNNTEKGLLRDAFKDFLPEDIYNRKKNPYPKTHSPIYRDLIVELLKESLNDKENILLRFFNYDKLINLINTGGQSFKYPWFGQLMTGPQLLAYFYQIYLWGRIYQIKIELE